MNPMGATAINHIHDSGAASRSCRTTGQSHA
jgi:hypothetical protein